MMILKREREKHAVTVRVEHFNIFSQEWITRQNISRERFEFS